MLPNIEVGVRWGFVGVVIVLSQAFLVVVSTTTGSSSAETKAYIGMMMKQCPHLSPRLRSQCSLYSSCAGKCEKKIYDFQGPKTCSCDDDCYLNQDCCFDKGTHCPRVGEKPVINFSGVDSVCLKNGYRVITGCQNPTYQLNTMENNTFKYPVVTDLNKLLHYRNEEVLRCNQVDGEASSNNIMFWRKVMKLNSQSSQETVINLLNGNGVLDEPPAALRSRVCYPNFKFMFCFGKPPCDKIVVLNITAMCEEISLSIYDYSIPEDTTTISPMTIKPPTNQKNNPNVADRTSTLTIPTVTDTKPASTLPSANKNKVDQMTKDEYSSNPFLPNQTKKPAVCLNGFEPTYFGQEQNEDLHTVVLYDNREDKFIGKITAANSGSQRWQEMLCRFSNSTETQDKETYECMVSKCERGYFFNLMKCLAPIKLKVKLTLPISVDVFDFSDRILMSVEYYQNMKLEMVFEDFNVTEKAETLFVTQHYLIKEIQDEDQHEILPISLHVFNASNKFLTDPQILHSITLCFIFSDIDSGENRDTELQRCDNITAHGIYSGLKDYPTLSHNDSNSEQVLFGSDENNAVMVVVTSLLEMFSVFLFTSIII